MFVRTFFASAVRAHTAAKAFQASPPQPAPLARGHKVNGEAGGRVAAGVVGEGTTAALFSDGRRNYRLGPSSITIDNPSRPAPLHRRALGAGYASRSRRSFRSLFFLFFFNFTLFRFISLRRCSHRTSPSRVFVFLSTIAPDKRTQRTHARTHYRHARMHDDAQAPRDLGRPAVLRARKT